MWKIPVRSRVLRLIAPVHGALRRRKLKLFSDLIGNSPRGSLLDVGGGIGIAGEFLPLYQAFSSVTVVNLLPPSVSHVGHCSQALVGDGRRLPLESAAFDWVFSNAVIEHVGSFDDQKLFANEIRRVARQGYFVTTPNKYFPIEPHTLMPFFQFLSPKWQRTIVRFTPGYLREYEEIHLLSIKQLRTLFPEAQVVQSGLPGFGNSLVAFYRVPPR